MHPPIMLTRDQARTRAMQAHPSLDVPEVRPASRALEQAATSPGAEPAADAGADPSGQLDDGSLVAEYGLVAVVGATVAALVINWASNGNIFELFSAVLDKVKVLVGA